MEINIYDRKDEVLNLIKQNTTKVKICMILECRPTTLEKLLSTWNISYKGNKGRKNISHFELRKDSYFYLGTNNFIGSHKLKLKLIEDGIKELKCENCNLYEWMGESIPIELHHIDGNRFNNSLCNLQILCPNCHSKTDNNSGKGKKKKEIKHTPNKKEIKSIKKTNICHCGESISKGGKMCIKCKGLSSRKVERPTIDNLKMEVEKLGYCAVGRKYGVSDNTIRKWIK